MRAPTNPSPPTPPPPACWPPLQVYAIDLLGQGGSEKPLLAYEMELWRDQILDFMAEFVQQPAAIVGNSLGSLASLMVAAAAPERVAGVTLLNCAGGGWRGRRGLAGRCACLRCALALQRPARASRRRPGRPASAPMQA